MPRSVETTTLYIRDFVFGFEDGVVSTVGLLAGIAAAGVSKEVIVLTGLVLISVEAFSMGVSCITSEHLADEFRYHRDIPISKSYIGGVIVFISYLIAGTIPILPYILFSGGVAFWLSIISSLSALVILGLVSAKMFRVSLVQHTLQLTLLGSAATVVGVVIGVLFHQL